MSETTLPTTSLAPARARSWVRVLLMLVIFLSGFAVGAYSAGVFIRGKVIESIKNPETVPPRIATRLRRILNLSDEQTQQATAILEERRVAIQSIRREFQPQIEAELDQAQTEISAILNDTQRQRWQQHFKEMRAMWVPPVPQ